MKTGFPLGLRNMTALLLALPSLPCAAASTGTWDQRVIAGDLVYPWNIAYGHHNPQGLAWSEDGRLFVAEHGPTGHDEINVIVPGGNYGWPRAVGKQRPSGLTPPLLHSGNQTWAPAGIAFFKGQLMVVALRASRSAGPDRLLLLTPAR